MDNNGFAQIEDRYLAMLYSNDSLSYETRVLLFLIRKIIGFHKTKDKVSYTEITNATGIDRRRVIECVQRLEEKGVIKVSRKSKCINIIALLGSAEKRTRGSAEKRPKLVRNSAPSTNKTKEHASSALHSLSECKPRGKDSNIEELEKELGDEYE